MKTHGKNTSNIEIKGEKTYTIRDCSLRGEWGRRFMERLWTVLSTCEKQTRDVLNFLEECLLSFWHDKSPPTLASAAE